MRSLLCLALLPLWMAGQPRVVIVDIDGLRRDTLEAAYLKGTMPNFERILGKNFSTAVWFENATSVFPPVTMSGQASIFTGVPPARHGMPGNVWFDRVTSRTINYLSVTGIPCVYGFLPIGAGDCAGGVANRDLQAPTLYQAATAAGKTSIVVFSQYWKGATHAVLPSISEIGLLVRGGAVDAQKFDYLMTTRAVEALKQYGLPDILTVYFDGADAVGHARGTAGQLGYLSNVLDRMMGGLLDTIESLDQDWRSHTQFVITSDHGRTDAPAAPEDKTIEEQVRKQIGSADRVRVVADNGVVHVYVKSGSRWTDPPRPEDIGEVAKTLTPMPSSAESLVVRKNGPGSGYRLPDDSPVPEEKAALLRSMDSARTGDLLLLLKPGRYAGNAAPNGAQHGSIYPQDRAVPIVLALGGVNPGRSPVPLCTTDIARIVATYLGIPWGML